MWRLIAVLTTVLLITGCGGGTSGSNSSNIPNLAEGNNAGNSDTQANTQVEAPRPSAGSENIDNQSTDAGVDPVEQLPTPFTATLLPNENGTITIYGISFQLSEPLDFAKANPYSFTLFDENNEKVGNYMHYQSDTNRIL